MSGKPSKANQTYLVFGLLAIVVAVVLFFMGAAEESVAMVSAERGMAHPGGSGFHGLSLGFGVAAGVLMTLGLRPDGVASS